MRPHIGHLRFYVGVLKKPIQSCTGKAEDSNHRLERKTTMLQICPRPKEPLKQIKEGQESLYTKGNKERKDILEIIRKLLLIVSRAIPTEVSKYQKSSLNDVDLKVV